MPNFQNITVLFPWDIFSHDCRWPPTQGQDTSAWERKWKAVKIEIGTDSGKMSRDKNLPGTFISSLLRTWLTTKHAHTLQSEHAQAVTQLSPKLSPQLSQLPTLCSPGMHGAYHVVETDVLAIPSHSRAITPEECWMQGITNFLKSPTADTDRTLHPSSKSDFILVFSQRTGQSIILR